MDVSGVCLFCRQLADKPTAVFFKAIGRSLNCRGEFKKKERAVKEVNKAELAPLSGFEPSRLPATAIDKETIDATARYKQQVCK